MFADTFAVHGIPEAVHADSGPAMSSTLLQDLLGDLGVTQTHNRPRVSNDNPFSESEFRTVKYRPKYPGTFTDIESARAYMAWYVPWSNEHHKHSGVALFSPNEVHGGTWRTLWHQRDQTQTGVLHRTAPEIPPPAQDPHASPTRRHQPAPQPEAGNETTRLQSA